MSQRGIENIINSPESSNLRHTFTFSEVSDYNRDQLSPEYTIDQVYNFDITKYQDGTSRFIAACNRNAIQYIGRVLYHGATPKRKTKLNSVQFDWSGVSCTLRVTRTKKVAIRLKGDGNYFNVFINGHSTCILLASLNPTICVIATDLNPMQHYTVTISKRTEPQMRGVMATFKICTFYGFIVDGGAEILPPNPPSDRKIEFIGDSDTCAFGNEGKVSSAKNIFGIKGRMENVYNGYASITSRMFNADTHILAWSGKGVHSNSGDWGPNLPALWKNTLASRDGEEWDMNSFIPDIVVINLGINDLSPLPSSEADIIAAYALFINEVRTYRPNAHIFCIVCDENCMSCEDSNIIRSQVSKQLQDIVQVAINKVLSYRHDPKLHYTFLQVDGGLLASDYATHMHYAVSGHVKIAKLLAEEIVKHTEWTIDNEPNTMRYPQQKYEILVPKEDSKLTNCHIS